MLGAVSSRHSANFFGEPKLAQDYCNSYSADLRQQLGPKVPSFNVGAHRLPLLFPIISRTSVYTVFEKWTIRPREGENHSIRPIRLCGTSVSSVDVRSDWYCIRRLINSIMHSARFYRSPWRRAWQRIWKLRQR